MDPQHDLAVINTQEQRLRFERFDASAAWTLGTLLKSLAERRGVAVTIEVRIARQTVFLHAMQGTSLSNEDWARRKRNVVELLNVSSYRISRELARDGGSLEERMGLPSRDYASHGGSFPIHVNGVGVIGAVTVSGLPQREDHAMVVQALAEMTGVPLEDVRLAAS